MRCLRARPFFGKAAPYNIVKNMPNFGSTDSLKRGILTVFAKNDFRTVEERAVMNKKTIEDVQVTGKKVLV